MYTMILDTEFISNKMNRIVYNIGYIIVKNKTEIIKKRSIVINENFDYLCKQSVEEDKMFAKNKIKILIDYKLHTNNYTFMNKKDFENLFLSDLTQYNVKLIWAYNCPADLKALQSINNNLTDNIMFCDIMVNCRMLFTNTKKYKKFCDEKKYFTISEKTGKKYYKYSAEIIYKFLIDENFIEEHTALKDVFCEFELLKKCYDRRKKMYAKKGISLKDILKNS